MDIAPTYSPWGQVDDCNTLLPGVYLVSTPSHGGVMVSQEAKLLLSPEARVCGMQDGGYLCFEEDCAENVVLRDLLDRGLWKVPSRIQDPTGFETAINRNIQEYNPAYWAARNKREERKQNIRRPVHPAR